jgi:hypothetical protein
LFCFFLLFVFVLFFFGQTVHTSLSKTMLLVDNCGEFRNVKTDIFNGNKA